MFYITCGLNFNLCDVLEIGVNEAMVSPATPVS